MLAAIAALAMLCRSISARCAVAVGSFFVLLSAAAATGILSMVGQMFGFPLIDGSLAAADRLLGVTASDVVRMTVAIPGAPRILAVVYVLSVMLVLISGFALGMLGRAERAWELCAAFSFCILVATVVSFLFPAVGAFEYSGIAKAYGSQLPHGSGVYHLPGFYALRGAHQLVINPFNLDGLVTFPSFHTSMALMTAAAWRDDRFLRLPMIGWNVLVILSTIPIGGHYLVDLVGGAAAWFVIFHYGPGWSDALMSLPARSTLRVELA